MQLADLGRGGRQGRGARGRFVPRAARLLRLESRQALARRQPQDARRPPDRPAARRARRRRRWRTCGPVSPSVWASATTRLQRDQPAAHLFLGHGVRLERARLRPARLRSGLSGAGRPDDACRASAGRRSVSADRSGRLLHGGAGDPGHPRRRSSRASGPGGASAWRPRCCAACWRSRRACAIDYPSKPTVRFATTRPIASIRRATTTWFFLAVRQPGVLGEALQGARASTIWPTIRASPRGSRGSRTARRSCR